MWVFITTLFIIVKNCKQPRCPSTVECINTLVHPFYEILLKNYKKGNINTYNDLDESPEIYTEWKISILKDYITYDYNYITFLKLLNYENGKH